MTGWRPYRKSDEAALRRKHAAQCSALGEAFTFPDFSDPRYLVVEVMERDGEVVGAVAAHATLEVMFIGGDPLMARAAVGARERLAQRLRAAGGDEAHAFVPRTVLRRMEPILRRLGFRRSNERYTPFYREL
ncbi:MAG: hypothetical protein ACRD1L_10540 [Terriglobales bacterium]